MAEATTRAHSSAPAKESDELDTLDELYECLRLARGILGVAHGAACGEGELADGDMGDALFAAYEQLKGAEAAAGRLDVFRKARDAALAEKEGAR